MKAAYNFQRYQDQFIFMERKNIERLFVNFYKHKLPKHHIQRDVLSMTAIISKIFITWDDYQQFMDDHPTDFCLALKGVTLISSLLFSSGLELLNAIIYKCRYLFR